MPRISAAYGIVIWMYDDARGGHPLARIAPLPKLAGMADLVSVTDVTVLGHYRLRLTFSDGLVRDVDLSYLHDRGPIFEALGDSDFFRQVAVDPEGGTIVWPNGADLDPLVLHGDFESASGRQIA